LLEIQKKKEQNQKILQNQLTQEIQEKLNKKNYLMGKFNPAQRNDFVLIPKQNITDKQNQNKMYLRKETLNAFLKMTEAADEDGINLKITSATRNFYDQKNIWDNKWSELTLLNKFERFKKILEYSAVPSTSRHHWGTEIDINNTDPSYFNTQLGKTEYTWLTKNASRFGFCQPYNKKGTERKSGYNEEKWHWSYFPLSKTFTEEYKNLIKNEDIKGFSGDEYVPELNLINDYVLSVNTECL
jgi:LAS superfamily LD-carboxypeptidase LdcB